MRNLYAFANVTLARIVGFTGTLLAISIFVFAAFNLVYQGLYIFADDLHRQLFPDRAWFSSAVNGSTGVRSEADGAPSATELKELIIDKIFLSRQLDRLAPMLFLLSVTLMWLAWIFYTGLAGSLYFAFNNFARQREQVFINFLTFNRIDKLDRYSLYLRSFDLDGYLRLRHSSRLSRFFGRHVRNYRFTFNDFQEELRSAFAASAPLVAIGNSDDVPLVPKLNSSDEDWREAFIDLAGRAESIVMVPLATEGTLWEIDWIIENAIEKTIFVMPPAAATKERVVQQWVRAHNIYNNSNTRFSQCMRPDTIGYAADLYFNPVPLTGLSGTFPPLVIEDSARYMRVPPLFPNMLPDEWDRLEGKLTLLDVPWPKYQSDGKIFKFERYRSGLVLLDQGVFSMHRISSIIPR